MQYLVSQLIQINVKPCAAELFVSIIFHSFETLNDE